MDAARGAVEPRHGGELTFTLPLGQGGAATEMFRVRDESEAELGLPASFFTGVKTFAPTRSRKVPAARRHPRKRSPRGNAGVSTLAYRECDRAGPD
jgi:hypothetical protein